MPSDSIPPLQFSASHGHADTTTYQDMVTSSSQWTDIDCQISPMQWCDGDRPAAVSDGRQYFDTQHSSPWQQSSWQRPSTSHTLSPTFDNAMTYVPGSAPYAAALHTQSAFCMYDEVPPSAADCFSSMPIGCRRRLFQQRETLKELCSETQIGIATAYHQSICEPSLYPSPSTSPMTNDGSFTTSPSHANFDEQDCFPHLRACQDDFWITHGVSAGGSYVQLRAPAADRTSAVAVSQHRESSMPTYDRQSMWNGGAIAEFSQQRQRSENGDDIDDVLSVMAGHV